MRRKSPQDEATEKDLAFMQTHWPSHLYKRLAESLRRAGAKQPEETGMALVNATGPCRNQNRAHNAGAIAMLPSTYSERLRDADLEAFQAAFNDGCTADLEGMLQRYPPDDGDLHLIMDGHEKDTTGCPPHLRRRSIKTKDPQQTLVRSVRQAKLAETPDEEPTPAPLPLRARRAHLRACHSSNKRHPFCLMFLFVVATWQHQGKRFTVLVGVKVLTNFRDDPGLQMKFLLERLKAIKHSVKRVILDRGYDARSVRLLADEAGVKLVVRLKIYTDRKRHIWDAKTGAKLDANRELERTASMDLPPVAYRYRDQDGRRVQGIQKTRTLDCRLDPDGAIVTVVLRAGYKIDFRGKVTYDARHSFLLMAPLGMPADVAKLIYEIRWSVESWLGLATDAAPRNRAQNLNPEVMQYYAYLLRIQLGVLAKKRLAAICTSGKWRGKELARWAVTELGALVLGLAVPKLTAEPGIG